jgi:hypothetical protein
MYASGQRRLEREEIIGTRGVEAISDVQQWIMFVVTKRYEQR